MSRRYTQHIVIGCMFVALTLSIGFFTTTLLPAFPVISDSEKYDFIALSLTTNGEYPPVEEVLLPPLYPATLAGIYSIFGHNYESVYLFQFALLGVTSFFVFLITRNQLGMPNILSLCTGVVVLFWPYMNLYSMLLMSTIVYITLFVIGVYVLIRFTRTWSKFDMFLSGMLLGLMALTRPVALLLPFWIFLYLAISHKFYILKNNNTLIQKRTVGMLLVFLLVLSPWMIYSYTKTGVPHPAIERIPHAIDKAYTTLSYEKNPDNINTQTSEIHKEISQIIKSKIKNIFLFWNPGAGGYQAEQVITAFPKAIYLIIFYKIAFFAILFLAFLSLLSTISVPIRLIWTLILYTWLLHTLLFPFPRYTLPIIPLVIILAFHTIWRYEVVIHKIKRFTSH